MHGDYFLLIHILQYLNWHQKEVTFVELYTKLGILGYTPARINEGVRYLAIRQLLLEDREDDPFVRRTFPLVMVDVPTEDALYQDQSPIRITPWGSYHIEVLIKQAQYWKHIFYDLVLPASLANKLNVKCIHRSASELSTQLQRIFGYLAKVETNWLYGFTSSKLEPLGITPIIKTMEQGGS